MSYMRITASETVKIEVHLELVFLHLKDCRRRFPLNSLLDIYPKKKDYYLRRL